MTRRKRTGGGRLRRSRTAAESRCWWCHKVLDVRVGTDPDWWSGYDLEISDLWPAAGVHVCGPQCPQRPVISLKDGRQLDAPVIQRHPLALGKK